MNFREAVKGLIEEAIHHDVASRLLDRWSPFQLWYQACHSIVSVSAFQPFFDGKDLLERHVKCCLTQDCNFGDILHSFYVKTNRTGIYKITVGKEIFLYITKQKGEHAPQQPFIDSRFKVDIEETRTRFRQNFRRFGQLDNIDPPNESRNVRRRLNNNGTEEVNNEERVSVVEVVEEETVVDPFWESTEARKLFRARTTDPDARVCQTRKIEQLHLVNLHKKTGYKLILDGGDLHNECTNLDIITLKVKLLILLLVYKTCLCRMGAGGGASFAACINEVLELLDGSGIDQATHFQTVQEWNRIFRARELWPHPRGPPGARNQSDPPLFEVYSEAKERITQYCCDNIRDNSCEQVHDYILDSLVPEDLIPKWIDPLSAQDAHDHALGASAEERKTMFLSAHQLSTLSLSTVLLRWMKGIGMKYQTKSKSFYVDGHEQEEVVNNCIGFLVNTNLREWEPRCLQFVRLTEAELCTIPDLLESDCLRCIAKDGSVFFEVHEDQLHKLGEEMVQLVIVMSYQGNRVFVPNLARSH
jgi:hypothetical protein